MLPFPPSLTRTIAFITAFTLALSASNSHAAEDPSQLSAATALYNAGKNDEARKAFEAIIAEDPANTTAHHHLGYIALRRNDPDTAIAHFEKAIALEPNRGAHHRGLGDAFGTQAMNAGLLFKVGPARRCLAAYQRAVELDPADIQGRRCLFEYYRQAPGFMGGGKDKAAAQASAIKNLDPVRGHIAFATLHADEKAYADAFAEIDEALKAHPQHFSLLFELGNIAVRSRDQTERGLAALRRCLELSPADSVGAPGRAAVHWQIGNLLQQQRDMAGARAAYETSLKINPAFSPAVEALKKLR